MPTVWCLSMVPPDINQSFTSFSLLDPSPTCRCISPWPAWQPPDLPIQSYSVSSPSSNNHCCLVAKSCLTLCDSHRLQHASLSCPSVSHWSLLRLMFTESVMSSNHLILCRPLLLPPSIFPSIRGFSPMSWLFISGGQSIGASTSASALPMNIQCRSPLWFTGLVSLLSKGLSRIFFSTTIWKYQFLSAQPSLWSISHICTWLLEKS